MAIPIKFEDANDVLLGGDPEVLDLPIRRGTDIMASGTVPTVISCWQLSPEELKEIIETGVVYLKSWGITHPPICVIGNRQSIIQ